MAVETKRLISVTDPDLLYPWPGPGLRPGGPGFLPPGYFLPPGTSPGLFPRTPGQGTTPQGLIDALAARGIQGVTNETAWFLLMVYGGPDTQAQGISADEIILAMTQDGSLTTEGGISTVPRLDLKAIDPKLIAQAIFHEAGVDPSVPGTALDANLLRFGTQILTGNPNAHSDELAVTLIRMFGSGGVITVEQLAEAIGGGAMEFSQDAGAPFLSVTHNYDRAGIVAGRETQYLLSFDTNGDGGVDWQELQTGLQSNLYENQVIDPKMAQMLWHFYGTNVNGTWVITAEGLDAMKADGVLRDWANSDGSAGFAISLASINPDRFVAGLMRYDRDNSGDLQPGELSEILTFYAGADGRVDPEITRRLGILYGGRNGIEADGLKQMLAEGVLVPATGPGGAETAGFRINLDAVPTERVVDRMFLYLGKDPATATMTTEEFERAIDFVTGDENPINGDVAAYIGAMRGVPDGAGGHTLNRAQVLSVFTSGAITRKSEPGLSIIPIQNNVNHEVPKHHHHHWWDSVFKFFKDEAKDVVATISEITGIAEHIVADIFNGKMSIQDALTQGGGKIVSAIVDAVRRGEEGAKLLIDQLGAALLGELKELGAEAQQLVKDMIAAAKETGEEMAIKTLTALSGMSAEQAHDFLTSMAAKGSLVDFANNLTYDDVRSMVPDYDNVMAELEAMADEFMDDAAANPAARRTLQAAGYSFDDKGNLMQGARLMSVEDKRDIWAKHFRADAALELNLGTSKGLQFNGLQVRVFVCYTGRDANGNKTMQLRFRILDEAGAAVGNGTRGGDAGMITTHDLVLSWAFTPDGTVKGDTKWNSTLGFIGEGNFGANLFKHFWTPAAGPNPPTETPKWNPDLLDSEIGVGVGWTVSYNLTEMGSSWWKPFVAELGGLAIGGGATAGALVLGETFAPEFFTGIIAEAGVTAVNSGAMLGSFIADVIFAKADHNQSEVSGEGGFFVWAAARGGIPKFPIGNPPGYSGGTGQARVRFQINASSAPTVMF